MKEDKLLELEALLARKKELELRNASLEIEQIRLKERIGIINSVQAAIESERVSAVVADKLLEHGRFRSAFCQEYQNRENSSLTVDKVTEVSEVVFGILTIIYPSAATIAVATLAAVSLLKKGLDNYCNSQEDMMQY